MRADSVALGIVVCVGTWFFIRHGRRTWRSLRGGGSGSGRSGSEHRDGRAPQARTMPRIGSPGTITKAQRAALRKNLFQPSRDWSREEADLVLDAVTYLRAVWTAEVSREDAPLKTQNELLAFILLDGELHEYVRSWGETRRREGRTTQPPKLPRNTPFERVAEEAARFHRKAR